MMFKKLALNSLALTFLFISCASSGGSSKKSTAAQRAIETREYDVNTKELMQSTLGAFQDLGYTIDTINQEFGLITASKIEEPNDNIDDDERKGLLGVLAAVVVVGAILGSDWEDNDNCLFCGSDDDGKTVVVKDYKLTATATVKAINDSEPFKSSLRVNFGSFEKKITLAFFKDFFSAIDKSLFLNENS